MSLAIVIFRAILCIIFLKCSKRLYTLISRRLVIAKLPAFKQKAYPIVGHLYLFSKGVGTFLPVLVNMCKQMMSDSEEKFAVFWRGSTPNVFIYHPAVADILLKTSKHIEKSEIYDMVKPWLREGLLRSKGSKWAQRRRLITPTFHFNILEDFLAVMNEQSLIFMKKLDSEVSANKEINVMKMAGLCALDIICETAMGCRINAQEESRSAYVEAIHEMLMCFQLRRKNPFFSYDFIFNRSKLGKRQRKTIQTLHDFTRKVVVERMKANSSAQRAAKKRMALLDVLLMAQTDDGQSLTAADIQEEVDTFMFAGHDTSTVALTWALYALGRNPKQQRKLQDELDCVLDGVPTDEPITSDQLRQLTYMDQVIKEVMRLYPPVPFISRKTAEDCVISGHRLPKGVNVTLFIYMIHRNPKVWSDPGRFDPERFAKDDQAGRHAYSHVPFSAGVRNCIGQRFALQEQKVLLSMFFRRFSVAAHDDEDELPVQAGIVMRPAVPLRLTVTKRE